MGPETKQEKTDILGVPYAKAVGKTLYLLLTRLDAIAAISNCARFMTNPDLIHWKVLKRILRYLSDTRYWGLIYRSTGHTLNDLLEVILYVDSDQRGLGPYIRSRQPQIQIWIPNPGQRMPSHIRHRHAQENIRLNTGIRICRPCSRPQRTTMVTTNSTSHGSHSQETSTSIRRQPDLHSYRQESNVSNCLLYTSDAADD